MPSVTLVHTAKAVVWNEMLFGRNTPVVSSNIAVDWVPSFPHETGDFGVEIWSSQRRRLWPNSFRRCFLICFAPNRQAKTDEITYRACLTSRGKWKMGKINTKCHASMIKWLNYFHRCHINTTYSTLLVLSSSHFIKEVIFADVAKATEHWEQCHLSHVCFQ